MPEVSRGLVASPEHNKIAPDYFGLYTREVAEFLSEDDDFLPLSSGMSEACGRTSGVVGDKVMGQYGHNGKITGGFSSSGSLFSDGVGTGVSDFKREKFKALLRQTVIVLTKEVDEMVDPVLAMRQLQSEVRSKKRISSFSPAASHGDAGECPQKKLKISSSPSFTSSPEHATSIMCGFDTKGSGSKDVDSKLQDVPLSGNGRTNAVKKKCSACHTTETSQWKSAVEGSKALCNACWSRYKKGTDSSLGSNAGAEKGDEEVNMSTEKGDEEVNKSTEKENGEVNMSAEKGNGEVDDDLKFLLESDSSQVEEIMKKHSNEFLKTLGYMEKQLEELLDAVISKCRIMTLNEKQKLQNLIQKLPQKNLDRIFEIVEHGKCPKNQSCNETHVNLKKESDATLWRLYFYIKAVEKARNSQRSSNIPQLD